MGCITSTHFSININGRAEGFFPGKRGLRQGDPLSPYLFVLSMEILSRLLRHLPSYPGFSYHPKCVKLNLTHLVFADDQLVFTRGDVPSVVAVARCLEVFAGYSGLQANPFKSL
ncbi:putative mitochondrial protein AtMg01250 [Silene latifolia]|uniref:putative mitochondrial protein AtMg01250 n=1 Tax=Silene latifolia TaxID=37657 RepID=UPI003D78650F